MVTASSQTSEQSCAPGAKPQSEAVFQSRQWRLHVGTHKTASTHLQAVLEVLRPQLEAADIGFASLDQLRPIRALDLRLRRPKVWIGGAPLGREITAKLGTQVALKSRMIVSEEDILGHAGAPLDKTVYPMAGFRVGRLGKALNAEGIWLSVRSFDRFMPAAYATALKHMVPNVDAATLKARMLATPPDWCALVGRLLRAAPGVPITVWDYADYRANSAAILADLTGYPLTELPHIPDPVATKTPDNAAIAEAEKLRDLRDPHDRAARIGEIYEAATGPRFSLFSDAEAVDFQARHTKQLAQIRAMPNVRVLTF